MKKFFFVVLVVLTLGIALLVYLAVKKYGSLSAAGQALDTKIAEIKTKVTEKK